MSNSNPLLADHKNEQKRSQHLNAFIDNSTYLDSGAKYSCNWETLFDLEEKKLDVSLDHAFSIILSLKYPEFIDLKDDLNTARVILGIKDQQKEYKPSSELGLYLGRLYLNDIFDSVTIEKAKLVEGIWIILEVTPRTHGKTKAKLMAVDNSGTILTQITTSRYSSSDWKGGISTGAHFKSLRIEGLQSTY